jgi:hypothetical protein
MGQIGSGSGGNIHVMGKYYLLVPRLGNFIVQILVEKWNSRALPGYLIYEQENVDVVHRFWVQFDIMVGIGICVI